MDLEVVVPEFQGGSPDFSLAGTCPHCRAKASFSLTGRMSVHTEPISSEPNWRRWCPVMRCAACSRFILAIVKVKESRIPLGGREELKIHVKYETHYPAGSPDDTVAEEIPEAIATDFREALRCRWVDGYNATVEMCRRAIEGSCIQLGAKPKLSITQKIDWVHKQGRINKTLKNVAHKIRLGGNRGSHPIVDPSVDPPITPEEADAVIAFTRHYFDHVYVVEKRMAGIDFSKSTRKQQAISKSHVSTPKSVP